MEETYPNVGFAHKWHVYMNIYNEEEKAVQKDLAKRGYEIRLKH